MRFNPAQKCDNKPVIDRNEKTKGLASLSSAFGRIFPFFIGSDLSWNAAVGWRRQPVRDFFVISKCFILNGL